MTQEFVTSYGKVIIERNILYIKAFDLPFSKTAFAAIAYNLFWLLLFVLQFFREEGPRKYIGIVLFGLLLLSRLPKIYDVLVKRSYAARIPLHRISSLQIKEEGVAALNVAVILRLKNGRYREILFRKLEQQYEPFIECVTPYFTQPQFA